MDIKHCAGCEDDFYNGKNPMGVKECWMLDSAELKAYRLIPVDLRPPYLHIEFKQIPTCYRKKRYVKVGPNVLDSKGYWK